MSITMRTLIDIVDANPQPLTLPPDTSVKYAFQEMRQRHADTVLVTDETGGLVGIFTQRDAVARVVQAGVSPGELQLGDVMTPDPVCLAPETPAIEALRLMWDGGFRHVPVTEAGKVVGCVSRDDFQSDERECHDHERELWEHMR